MKKETIKFANVTFEPTIPFGDFFNAELPSFVSVNLKKEGQSLGFAELILTKEAKDFRYLYLSFIYIKPSLRSQGYGKLLLEAVEALAKKYGVGLIRADLDLEKTKLADRIKFFKNQGYTVVRHHSHDGIDIYKKINPNSRLDKFLTKSFTLGNSYLD